MPLLQLALVLGRWLDSCFLAILRLWTLVLALEVVEVLVQELEQVVQVSVLDLRKGYMQFELFGRAIQMKLLLELLRLR